MNKLVALLNEYRTEKGERNLNEFEVSQTLDSLNYLRLFIKWLVDNDNIDFDKVYEKEENENIDICMSWKDADMYWLLMLLSIQDNPIEFLISILK